MPTYIVFTENKKRKKYDKFHSFILGTFSSEKYLYFSYFSKKTYVHVALLMSTHNVCFHDEPWYLSYGITWKTGIFGWSPAQVLRIVVFFSIPKQHACSVLSIIYIAWDKRGIRIFFFSLFLHKNIHCEYSLEALHGGASAVPTIYFLWTNPKQNPSRKHAYIMLTPLNHHFYIVKMGFTGVYIIVLISAQKHRLWVLVRTA